MVMEPSTSAVYPPVATWSRWPFWIGTKRDADMNTWDFSPSLMMALIRKGGRTMPIDTHNDRTPMSETEESCDTAKTDSGIPENNPLGKEGGPAGPSGEHSSEASAAAHSSHIDISGNTSTTLIPIRILTTPDLESQGDHGREI